MDEQIYIKWTFSSGWNRFHTVISFSLPHNLWFSFHLGYDDHTTQLRAQWNDCFDESFLLRLLRITNGRTGQLLCVHLLFRRRRPFSVVKSSIFLINSSWIEIYVVRMDVSGCLLYYDSPHTDECDLIAFHFGSIHTHTHTQWGTKWVKNDFSNFPKSGLWCV